VLVLKRQSEVGLRQSIANSKALRSLRATGVDLAVRSETPAKRSTSRRNSHSEARMLSAVAEASRGTISAEGTYIIRTITSLMQAPPGQRVVEQTALGRFVLTEDVEPNGARM